MTEKNVTSKSVANARILRAAAIENTPKEQNKEDRVDAAVDKFHKIREELSQNFVERRQVVEHVMGCYLAGQHVVLLGPPGTAKSALAEAVCVGLGGGSYFRYLLTRYTTPDELFGPRSVQGLKEDRFRRVAKGYMPEAKVVFLDEIFKANSAILNSLLTMVNERTWFDDGREKTIPLEMCIGASNELPEGPELAALYDRFVMRKWVDYVQDGASRRAIMTGAASGKPSQFALSEQELADVRSAASALPYEPDFADAFLDIEQKLADIGIGMSDRRRRLIYKTMPFLEFAAGGISVSQDTLIDCLPDMTWKTPEQQAQVYKVVLEAANPLANNARDILDSAHELVNGLEKKKEETEETFVSRMLVTRTTLKKMADKLIALDTNRHNRLVNKAVNDLGVIMRTFLEFFCTQTKMPVKNIIESDEALKMLEGRN